MRKVLLFAYALLFLGLPSALSSPGSFHIRAQCKPLGKSHTPRQKAGVVSNPSLGSKTHYAKVTSVDSTYDLKVQIRNMEGKDSPEVVLKYAILVKDKKSKMVSVAKEASKKISIPASRTHTIAEHVVLRGHKVQFTTMKTRARSQRNKAVAQT